MRHTTKRNSFWRADCTWRSRSWARISVAYRLPAEFVLDESGDPNNVLGDILSGNAGASPRLRPWSP